MLIRMPHPRPRFEAQRFKGLSPVAKLLWFYILHQGEGAYTVRGLAEALDLSLQSTHTALSALLERGLLVQVEPPAGSRPGRYRAA